MEKRPLGRTGFSVSVVGFGAAPAAFLKADAQRIAQLLNRLLDAGVNVIDTAASYPGSEQFIGEYLSPRRKDFVLISKCGQQVDGLTAPAWSRQIVLQSVDRALRLLRSDVIDVMLLHSCDLQTLKSGDALDGLLEARRAGKIRFAGYSGDNDAAAYAAALPDIHVVEMSINICDQANIDVALPVARKNNVGVIAKRPIANAAWKGLDQQPGMYRDYAKPYIERLAKMGLTPKDLGFEGDPAQVWPEIALRFTLSQPGVSTAIIGTTNPENAMANLAYARKGPLPPEAIQKIRDAFRAAAPAEGWPGLT